ncbi:peptidase T [Lachnobacterium bovis]|uniref:Peptidase T n=1 Tax=Lachnobacterium bovis DSM 14045 TaxID=1122142 RepID=A0A1H3G432_9FIRM|nr:peptidase T [Lachnobacterium bovis]SDX98001.1 tripeptide aminopeptidase [Lachnobacterium bovis DSM 14045]
MAKKVEERFLNYVSYWTTSDENSNTTPSSKREFSLGKVLESELNDLGLSNVKLDEKCYVYGLLPATPGMEDTKSIGFISHMDTAPDFSGENIKPQIIEKYDGKDILLKGSNTYLKTSDFPDLKTLTGKTLITTDGTTLLGADDKAGIAEIISALELIIDSKTPHGDIWVAFTPDEEIGAGASNFDLNYFKADYAYTVDGDYEGEVAYENFNAASATIKFKGVNVHPGEAKDIMVNSALLACEFANKLPKNEVPSKTCGREGFFHLTDLSGDVSHSTLNYIIRDHDLEKFNDKIKFLENLTNEFNSKYGNDTVTINTSISYNNMLSIIEKHMYVVDLAKDAIKSVGLDPISRPVRGGTDGAMLSFKGLPCPNLGTGGYGFHGPFEHIALESMQTVVKILVEIAKHPVKK